jgi:3-methyladenine DNA glycosylase/8-oxoguanine DNA glycosylase
MPAHTLALAATDGFHFGHTVYSHGWCALAPFSLRRDPLMLARILHLASGRLALVCLEDQGEGLRATLHTPSRATTRDTAEASRAARAMLNMDLDLAPFRARVRRDAHTRWMARGGMGRYLRGATFFEDVVKMILTTNCTWSLTEAMNTNLVRLLGAGDGALPRVKDVDTGDMPVRDFPAAEAIAACSEEFLRREVRLGYRAPSVLALARRVALEGYEIEAFRTSTATSDELYRELRTIRGVGDYAASNLLKLLGRFDRLGLDSWCRMKFAELHNGGTTASDAEIERFYARFEEWKGLVMWLDVTKDWYFEKFPD